MHDKKTILIIGPAPENIGGISIHIRRLVDMLKGQYIFDFVDEGRKRWPNRFNIRSLRIATYFKKVLSADVVHIHSGAPVLRIFNVIVAKWILRKRTVVTVHRDPNIEPLSRLTKYALSKPDMLICVSQSGIDAFAPTRKSRRTMLLPAFLPPVMDHEPQLPQEVTAYVNRVKTSGGRLMVSNAWRLVMKDDTDLYGLDICIKALSQLVARQHDWHLIFVVPDTTGSEDYLAEMKSLAERLKVADHMMLYTSSLSFVRLMRLADVVLRTTITDGDAITVREALYFNIPVVASDAVSRPLEVSLFKNRDVQALVNAIEKAAEAKTDLVEGTTDFKLLYNQIYTQE